jgi:hypothetical protein
VGVPQTAQQAAQHSPIAWSAMVRARGEGRALGSGRGEWDGEQVLVGHKSYLRSAAVTLRPRRDRAEDAPVAEVALNVHDGRRAQRGGVPCPREAMMVRMQSVQYVRRRLRESCQSTYQELRGGERQRGACDAVARCPASPASDLLALLRLTNRPGSDTHPFFFPAMSMIRSTLRA